MPDGVRDRKRALRREIADRRAAQRGDASIPDPTARLAQATTQHSATLVCCFLSRPTEPDTGGYLAWAAAHDVRVLLPVSREDGLLDWAEHGDRAAEPGLFGIREPTGPRLGIDAFSAADLLFIPAAAVDRSGRRLGWGRGYFDRMLSAAHPRTYAVVFDDEILDRVPAEAHDQPVDGVITPQKIVEFS